MRGSRKFCQRVSNFDNIFFCFDSEYHYRRAIIGPPAKRHLNGISLAFRCWPNNESWLGSFVFFSGDRTNIAKKPYIFVIFRGGGGVRTPFLPLDPCMARFKHYLVVQPEYRFSRD